MLVFDTARLCHAQAHARIRKLPRALAAFAASLVALALLTLGALAPVAAAHVHAVRVRRRHGCRYAHRAVTAATPRQMRRAVVCLINRVRRAHGLPPLRVSRRLNRSAQRWTIDMVRFHDFTHGADFAGRISSVGFNWSAAGENIATGFRTPIAAVRGWLASTGHCQNILNPKFAFVGTGVSRRRIGSLGTGPGTWTQDFALPAGWRAPSSDFGPAAGCPY